MKKIFSVLLMFVVAFASEEAKPTNDVMDTVDAYGGKEILCHPNSKAESDVSESQSNYNKVKGGLLNDKNVVYMVTANFVFTIIVVVLICLISSRVKKIEYTVTNNEEAMNYFTELNKKIEDLEKFLEKNLKNIPIIDIVQIKKAIDAKNNNDVIDELNELKISLSKLSEKTENKNKDYSNNNGETKFSGTNNITQTIHTELKFSQKEFWVGSPQGGVFLESNDDRNYKYYKCKIRSDNENEADFYFNEDPKINKSVYSQNEAERIYAIADVQGNVDANCSIKTTEPGILKRISNEEWLLKTKAKIRFG